MTVGLASAVLDGWLNALCNATNYTAPTGFWAKLHVGDPGASGTSNPATDTTTKSVSFGAAAAGGGGRQCATDASTDWTSLATADPDVLSHLSFWAETGATTFLGSAQLASSRTVQDGDNFSIPSGSGTITVTPVAA